MTRDVVNIYCVAGSHVYRDTLYGFFNWVLCVHWIHEFLFVYLLPLFFFCYYQDVRMSQWIVKDQNVHLEYAFLLLVLFAQCKVYMLEIRIKYGKMFKSCVYLQIFKGTDILHSLKSIGYTTFVFIFSKQKYIFKVATNINLEWQTWKCYILLRWRYKNIINV